MARREGLPEATISRLREDSPVIDDLDCAVVLNYTDSMTLSVAVSEEDFQAVASRFDDTVIAEITATIAAYNMVSRFLIALDVRTEDRRSSRFDSSEWSKETKRREPS